jgi:predicted DNA-binding antitoxin AbrB/MazE fold protein
MFETIRAIYRNGAFCPQTPCDLPEGSEVDLLIRGPAIMRPQITDEEERRRILQQIVDRMQNNPIPADAPRFSREELHERR